MGRLLHMLALVRKEFLAILKDPRSRTVIIVPPILQTIVFGYAATYDLNDVRYAVYDEDHSAASRELVAAFSGSPSFHRAPDVVHPEQVRQRVDSREVLMILHVQQGFERDLLAGRPAPLQVIVDARNSNTASIALNYARGIVMDFNARWLASRDGPQLPVRLISRAWFNPGLVSRWFIVPGIAGVLTLVVTVLVAALSVAREREEGTFDQLLVSPYSPVEILVGKAVPGFVIGMFEATFIVVIAVFWFRVPLRGNLLTLYAGLALFLMSTVGLGLMISSLSATMQQGVLGAFCFIMPAVILSGFSTPIANMPVFVQYLTLVNPLRYMLVIVRGVFLQGTSADLLVHQLWPMAVIGLASLALAGWMFRRRLY